MSHRLEVGIIILTVDFSKVCELVNACDMQEYPADFAG